MNHVQIVLVAALEGVGRIDDAESKEVVLKAMLNLAREHQEEDFLISQLVEVYLQDAA